MPTLIIRGADGKEQAVELSSELTVGREAGNDLVLSDKGVSRRHCRFFLGKDGAAVVEDLGSANGVLVGGRRIDKATPLRAGVEILIGGATVRLADARGAAATSAGATRAAPPSGSTRAGPPAGALARRAAAPPPPVLQKGGPQKATRMMTAKEGPPKGVKRPAGKLAGKGPPRLRGQGALSGLVLELDQPTMLVGRVAPADIVLDDDSVSRKHAEIVRAGTGVAVRDLGSANGTFVNGERVSEAPLSPGDVVRFGVMEFAYGGPAGRSGGRLNRKAVLLVAGGAAALGLLALVLWSGEHGGEGGGNRGAGAPPTSGQAAPAGPKDPLKELSRCKAFSDPDNEELNWKRALEVCSGALKLDPSLTEARELERKARKEIENEEVLRDAKLKASTSQEELALGLLVKIPVDSTSFFQARQAFKEATERLSKRARSACKTDIAAGAYGSAVDKCQKALEVTCNRPEGSDPEAKKLYEQAVKSTGARAAFVCPRDYAKFESQAAGPVSDDAEKLVRERYPDEPIGDLMVRYFNSGRPKQVADEFKRLRAKTARKYPQIDELIVLLELVDGRYASGQEGLRRNQPNLVWEYWKDAFDADGKLMPAGLRSYMVRDMSSQLAALDYKLGSEQYRMGRYSQAAKYIFDGYRLDKTNTDIIRMMANWDVLAKRMLDADSSCENAQVAMDVTLPESLAHKRAEQLRKEQACQ